MASRIKPKGPNKLSGLMLIVLGGMFLLKGSNASELVIVPTA